MVILATDSGLEKTGYALFKKEENNFSLINSGLIVTKKTLSLENRLMTIYEQFENIIKNYQPALLIIEKIFFNVNQKTIINIAQTQGVLLVLAAQNNIKVEFLTPLVIKQAITGYGRADKLQVRKMVKLLLRKEDFSQEDDVIDAIACGLAYCQLKKYDR